VTAIVLIDTSVLVEVLNVPGRNAHREAVLEQLSKHIEDGDYLFLPMAVIVEAGNHIAHLSDGRLRRQTALRFVAEMQKAISGESPWHPMRFPDTQHVLEWLADFPEKAMQSIGFGDLSIIKEWEMMCRIHPMTRVLIWSLDDHLRGYDRSI